MEEIEKLKKEFKDATITIGKDWISIIHPQNKDIVKTFDITNEPDSQIDLEGMKIFLSTKYLIGQSIARNNYFEAVVEFSNIFDYYDNESTTIKPTGKDYNDQCYFEIGSISEEFSDFLNQSIHWDNFSAEYFHSIKIYNFNTIYKFEISKNEFYSKIVEICSQTFFKLSSKHGLNLKLIDLSDYEKYEPEIEEADTSEIKSTIIDLENYDFDLVNYYNRAIHLPNSNFKYIAFFQVLECIFDELYLNETIQDTRSILNSEWFSSNNFEHVQSLIKLIERFSKEQNDRAKVKLILEKYFKMNLHDEAYIVAYSDISKILISLKLISSESELKDLQKIGNIIYDIRNEYTHSNRKFPKRKETNVETNKINEHIELIRLISKTIILNYKRP